MIRELPAFPCMAQLHPQSPQRCIARCSPSNQAHALRPMVPMNVPGESRPMSVLPEADLSTVRQSSSPDPRPSKRMRRILPASGSIQEFTEGRPSSEDVDVGAPVSRPRRATACDRCRDRKTKCDNQRPRCGYCARRDIACVYADDAPE